MLCNYHDSPGGVGSNGQTSMSKLREDVLSLYLSLSLSECRSHRQTFEQLLPLSPNLQQRDVQGFTVARPPGAGLRWAERTAALGLG